MAAYADTKVSSWVATTSAPLLPVPLPESNSTLDNSQAGGPTANDTATSVQPRRTLLRSLGVVRILVFLVGTLVILGVLGFLGFLWHSARAAEQGLPSVSVAAWRRILDAEWLLRSVTLASLLVRIVVAAQAATATEMLSSLLLESDGGCSLPDLARLSVTRCQAAGPYQLALVMRRQLHSTVNMAYAALLAVLLAVTVATQFGSTVLLTDFGSARVVGDDENANVSFAFNYDRAGSLLNPYNGANYWTARPLTYFRFAEDSSPATEEDGVYDTGFTARAFLPLANADQRVAARSYAGPSTVIDARVVCVRPRVTITSANLTASAGLNLEGRYSWDGQYRGLRPKYTSGGAFSCLIAPGSEDDKGPPQRRLSLCRVETDIAYLQGGVRDDRDSYTSGYLIVNSTAASERWIPFLKTKTKTYSDSYNGTFDPADFAESGGGGSGTWRSLRVKNSPVGIDATLCLTNPIPWNYQIAAESDRDGQEPSLRWNVTTGEYSSEGVRDFFGAVPGRRRRDPQDRGLLRLQPQSNWTAADADGALGVQTINYVWTAVQPRTTTPVLLNLVRTAPQEAELVLPHRGHVGLFQDVLAHTGGNAALALQTLFTTLMQMAYHDYVAEYDVGGPAAVRVSRAVVMPLQWKGFVGFCVVVAAHLVLVFVVAALFLARTATSLLGNAWQAVGQVVDATEGDGEVLVAARERTDGEVYEYLRSRGGMEAQVRLRPGGPWGSMTST